jgi:hypothetical protein
VGERLPAKSVPLALRVDRDPIQVPPAGEGRDADVGDRRTTVEAEEETDAEQPGVGRELGGRVPPEPREGGVVEPQQGLEVVTPRRVGSLEAEARRAFGAGTFLISSS